MNIQRDLFKKEMNFIRNSAIRIPMVFEEEAWFKQIVSDLTRTERDYDNPSIIKTKKYYSVIDGNLLIPRFYPVEKLGHISTLYLDRGKDIDLQFKSVFRNEQQELASNFMVDNDHGVLCMLPGEGKTVVAISAVCRMGKKSIIFVHKDSLATQWMDRFLEHSTIDKEKISVISTASYQDFFDKDVIICTVQTFGSMIKRLPNFENIIAKANFGVAFWDECIDGEHKVYTPYGSTRLKNLTVGESVLTSDNKYVRVKAIRTTEKESVKILLSSGKEFIMSADHPVLQRISFGKYECKPAKDCTHFLFHSISPSDRLHYTADEYLIGLYLGDGHIPSHLYENNSVGVIKGLFDTDGYITCQGSRIGIELTSKKAIYQLRDMLAYYGVFSRIKSINRSSKNANHSDIHRLSVSGINADRYVMLFGLPATSLGEFTKNPKRIKYHNNKIPDSIKLITPVGIRTLYDISIDSEDELFVCDGYVMHNCHTSVSAEWFSQSSLNIPARKTFGLSATPSRADGNTDIINLHLGNVFRPDGETDTLSPRVVVLYMDCRAVALHEKFIYSKEIQGKYIWKFDKKRYLNMLTSKKNKYFMEDLKRIVKNVYDSKRRAILLADRINILDQASVVIPSHDIGFFLPREKAKRDSALDKQFVFSTYGSARDGTDQPELDCLIMATNTSNFEQAIGRICRPLKTGSKQQPVVIDIVDVGCEEMVKAFEYRKAFYEEKGWEISEKHIKRNK